ncbi:B3 domain-containing protein At2g32645-like [Neltuma alba]|uniref:B3 domain-containing protein At2g32645-like n=1 Tax=Neltuma alba TaxID=207710 RepID=UPI0010A3E198|nr:B3 domain-containing protein At2g32645-like [Prosopis alba]
MSQTELITENQISRKTMMEVEEEEEEQSWRTNKKRKILDENNTSPSFKGSSNDRISPFEFKLLPVNKKNRSKPPQLLDLITRSPLMLPWKLKKRIDDNGGYNIRMIIEKKLYKSDLCKTNDRFSFPKNKILMEAEDFLKPQESELLMAKDAETKKLQGIPVLVLDPNLEEFDLVLKRWSMTGCFTYNLTHHWYDIVKCNNFQVGDVVQLWSFRRFDDQLGFALVKL